jgi:hypothetical protein
LPESLAEAGVEELDPFDSGSLRLLRTNGGFRVYSVGDDGKDDLGLTQYESLKRTPGYAYYSDGAPKVSWDLPSIFPAWDRAR